MADAPGGNPHQALESERLIMTAYSDTAKTYSQLSLGALVLSVTFFEKIANTGGKIAVETPLLIAWSGWLVCTVAGAFYQYLAARFLEGRGHSWGAIVRSGHPQAFSSLAEHPWPVYGVMLVAFAVGSLAFAIDGVNHLP